MRTAAQLASSQNNIRQINLFTHQLIGLSDDKIKGLPDGSRKQTRLTADQTVFSQLLPLAVPNRGLFPKNATVGQITAWVLPRVALYTSPADPTLTSLGDPGLSGMRGVCSYVVNQMAFDKIVRVPVSIPDGMSSTIAFGEHYYACKKNEEYLDYVEAYAALPQQQNGSATRRASFADAGWYDVVPVVENGVARPSQPGYTLQYMPKIEEAWGKVLQTPHPGGLPVGMMDGSVRTLRPGIVESVYWALVTPAGGEVVGDF